VLLAVVAAGALAAGLALLLYEAVQSAEERSTVRASLRALNTYEVVDVRQQELLIPLSQRILQPLGRSLLGLSRRFMPVGYMDRVREKLQQAGRGAPEDLDRFRAIRVLTVAAIPLVFLIVFVVLPLPMRTKVVLFGFLALLLGLGPDAQLNRDVTARHHEMRSKLPDLLDMLTISVEAGLGFEQALDRTVSTVPGPLSEEFLRMLGELRAGASRADALRNLDARTQVPELRSFVLALIQADTFGVSIGRTLRSQADEMRVKRRQMAQEQAQKAPTKMLFPMVLCVMPALFVVVLGPAVLNFVNSGGF
jgi:tight adherence protein C